MEMSLTGVVILLTMLVTLSICSYVTWRRFGKEFIGEIVLVKEPPSEISAMMAAYINSSRKETADYLTYIGLLELISKGFVVIEDYVDLKKFNKVKKNTEITDDKTEDEIKKEKKTVEIVGIEKYYRQITKKKYGFNMEEILSYFKKLFPFSQALQLQKNAIEMLEKSIKMSGFEDKKEYIENELNIFIYKDNKFMKSFGNELFANEILEGNYRDYYEEF